MPKRLHHSINKRRFRPYWLIVSANSLIKKSLCNIHPHFILRCFRLPHLSWLMRMKLGGALAEFSGECFR
jgi:hypothetical protein